MRLQRNDNNYKQKQMRVMVLLSIAIDAIEINQPVISCVLMVSLIMLVMLV